jgi:multidrug transporter EmrE-like cation transporter
MTPPMIGPLLVIAAATGYAGATVAMARVGHGYGPMILAMVGGAMAFAVIAETAAFRHLPIGIVYLAILGCETLLVLGAAACFGQALGVREALGAILVLSGALVLALGRG